jgi:hypothetical protein
MLDRDWNPLQKTILLEDFFYDRPDIEPNSKGKQ